MLSSIGIGAVVYVIIGISLLLFNLGFVKYYQSKRDPDLFSFAIAVMSLELILLTAALLPVDVYLVSSTVDHSTGLKKLWADEGTIQWITFAVKLLYYIFYGLISFYIFFLVPFAYFYYKDSETEPDARKKRSLISMRYAICFSLIGLSFFLFGLFMKPIVLPPFINIEWFQHLLSESSGAKAFWFVIGCLLLPAMVVLVIYTAPGLSILPIYLIKNKRKVDVENQTIHHQLDMIRDQRKALEHRYADSNQPLSERDLRALENYNDEERILLRKLNGVDEEMTHFSQKVLKVLRPFQVLIGLILLGFSFLIVISVLISIIDKIIYSVCGRKCGYIISHPDLINVVDSMFVHLQKIFPFDYIILVGTLIYFFFATMMGIIHIGVKVLWATLFRIKRHSTSPQGLLIVVLIIMFGILGFNYSMVSVIAPGYSHFGNQVYCNHTEGGRRDCSYQIDKIVPCDLWAPIEICTPTVSSTLIDRIPLNTPILGMIYFYSEWAFLLSFVLAFIISLFRPIKDSSIDLEDLYDSEDEQAGLLDSR
ncbi:hypothetical protein BDB01DRAFT_741934 [Pilobolus umbonatus]|nr:hypothetical protein BDB01DRAFT_741934 [Pilobolus umbonatus]